MKIKVLDPGHKYSLPHLDGKGRTIMRCLKRKGKKYPGNKTAYAGPTSQMYARALLDRARYVQKQIPDQNNLTKIQRLEEIIWLDEERAARLHGYVFNLSHTEAANAPMCPHCGHVVCEKLGNAVKYSA